MEINKATLRKSNETYKIYDTGFEGLVISSTILNAHCSTKGHKHPNEEFYLFVHGSGWIEIDNTRKPIQVGDMLIIRGDCFHKVYNKTDKPLIFICAWKEEK